MVRPLVRVGVFAAVGGVVGFVTSVVLFVIGGLVTGSLAMNARISTPTPPGVRLGFLLAVAVGTIAGVSGGAALGRVRVREPRKARVLAALIGAVLGFLVGTSVARSRHDVLPKPLVGTVVGAVILSALEFGLTASPRKPAPGPRHPLGDGDLAP